MTTNAPHPVQTQWKLDPAHTLVEFTARHMMITNVRGHFTGVEGTITIDHDHPAESSVEARIDPASLTTGVVDRDNHLRSADFLHTEQYPDITFRSTEISGNYRQAGDSFTVKGDLTIGGTTRPVTLDVEFEGEAKDPWGGTRVSFSADTKIDRRDFGLTWNKALEAGGVLVGNDIRIHIEAQAVAV
ncbi:MAG TPA: YceI family protein [Gemmatimonadales bacterium]|jgi:polyisoprenoid-binding protein YceI|nr:YceI family protein [Gemmatimonadales bacterium]